MAEPLGTDKTLPAGQDLRLKAEDADDLAVISACLQDAIVRDEDLAYDRRGHRFALIASRYCRESGDSRRARSLLRFDSVLSVQCRDWTARAPEAAARPLLALDVAPRDEGAADITLIFGGGGMIRLGVECIDVILKDLGQSWATGTRPDHGL